MKLLGDEIDVAGNIKFSFSRYWIFWLLLLATILLDFVSTLKFISEDGLETEANRLIKYFIENLGLIPGVILGKLLQLFSVLIFVGLNQRLGNIFMLVVILINVWAVSINIL